MSDLRKRLKSLNQDPAKFRSQSQVSSRSSSRIPSRDQSDDEGDEYTSYGLADGEDENPAQDKEQSHEIKQQQALVAEKFAEASLEKQKRMDSEDSGDKFQSNVDMLQSDRRGTSIEARILALKEIIAELRSKYQVQRYSRKLLSLLIKSFESSRSGDEFVLCLQAICLVAMLDFDESLDILSSRLVPRITSLLTESSAHEGPETNERQDKNFCDTNTIIAYSLLQYFAHLGGGGYGSEEVIGQLLFDFTQSQAASSVSAAVLGAGLLLGTIPNPSSTIEEFSEIIVDYLNNSSLEIRRAAGKTVACFYQNYVWSSIDSNQARPVERLPYYDHDTLLDTLRFFVSESSKRVSKEDKREQRSLFRSVLKTVELYSDAQAREDITPQDLLIMHVRLSRTREQSVDSWLKLILIQHLRWLYGHGLHAHIANNKLLQDALKASSAILSGAASSSWKEFDLAKESDVKSSATASQRRAKSSRERKGDIEARRNEKSSRLEVFEV